MDINQLIFEKFKIKDGGLLPFKCESITRNDLAKLMGEIGYRIGAEIGVQRGAYSERLCLDIPDLKLKCVDPWCAFNNTSTERNEGFYQRTRRRLRRFQAEIIRKSSMEAVREIEDESLDFVYIDELHEFDPVMMDLICWGKKVRRGGMITGHDYSNNYYRYGIIPAVDTYTKAHKITKYYITDEHDPSFFWVKP